jgi:hypothetical protein
LLFDEVAAAVVWWLVLGFAGDEVEAVVVVEGKTLYENVAVWDGTTTASPSFIPVHRCAYSHFDDTPWCLGLARRPTAGEIRSKGIPDLRIRDKHKTR